MLSLNTSPLFTTVWTCQYMGLLVILLLFSGCASTQAVYPPQVTYPEPVSVKPRTPDFQDAWDRCVQQDSGESYCSSKYWRVENSSPDSSTITEGEFVHSNHTREQSATGDVTVIISQPRKNPKQGQKRHVKQKSHTKQHPKKKSTVQTKRIMKQTPITCRISVIPCREGDIQHSRQIQHNIQSLRSSLHEWIQSQGDY